MMKFKYLFDNRALTEMILSHWEFDRDDPDFLKFFRISANGVYRFKQKGDACFCAFHRKKNQHREK